MKKIKKEGWINLYYEYLYTVTGRVYETRQKAYNHRYSENGCSSSNFLKTIKIEWTEWEE